MSTKNKGDTSNTIALNKKARHDYFIEDRFEAGLVLEGWEVKSLRAGRANLTESYVIVKTGEAWLLGAPITALPPVWQRGRAKVDAGLARGKKHHDKRSTEKEREWQRDKQRLLKAR